MWPPRAPRASTQRKISALCWYLLRPHPSRTDAGRVVAYSRASSRIAASVSSHAAARSASGRASSSARYSAKPCACRSRYPRSSRPSSRMTLAIAIASSASVATRGCTWWSQKFADSLRTGSIRITRPPRFRISLRIGTVWRLVAIGLRPQSSTRRLRSMSDGSWPARTEVESLAGPCGAAAERTAGGGHPAQQVPEAPAQELGGAPGAGALVVHDRQRARVGQVAADLLRHQVERLVPRDPVPAAVGPSVAPLERMELALRAVDALRESIGLAAEIALGELVIGMALELHHAPVLHVRDDPAAVRAIQGAGGVDLLFHPSGPSLTGMTGEPGGAGASRRGPALSTSRTRVRARGRGPRPSAPWRPRARRSCPCAGSRR